MRIVIDLQGAQGASRYRGIGRYSSSLAKAMVSNAGGHEILIALNGRLGNDIEAIRLDFDSILPQENIRVWYPAGTNASTLRRGCDELTREAFLAELKPDIVHISSLFEGMADASVATTGSFNRRLSNAVTLYDLIPYIYSERYLESPVARQWYMERLGNLRRSDLLLGISSSASREAVEYLGVPESDVVNISSAADDQFRKVAINAQTELELRQRLSLDRPYLMYTGGIDYRKNIEGLIRAYASLPESIRRGHQLAVVCSVNDESRRELEALAKSEGLAPGDFVLTGFVSDHDLVLLYNLCKLFVFPSWHEGFGLPILEAMHCGAPVIAADSSSLPEVVGRSDALFAPRSDGAIANKIMQVLGDDAFRSELAVYGEGQARKFTWKDSARRAIEAFEHNFKRRQNASRVSIGLDARPTLAFVSPLPPEKSGIANYSAELLPELARYYDIDVITDQTEFSDPVVSGCCRVRGVDWFARHHRRYDRVLYQFGNSHFHSHMFDLLPVLPGAVVLHDFFLSGIQGHRGAYSGNPNMWPAELYRSHGYHALVEGIKPDNYVKTLFSFPCNYEVLDKALGVIVHSDYSRRLARQWYGDGIDDEWALIPHLRVLDHGSDRVQARGELNIADNEFVICTFGHIAQTKQSRRLLDSWLKSKLSANDLCRLIFVGENDGGDYGRELVGAVERAGATARVKICGWTDQSIFRRYLAAADMAVQLRTLSRGETSGAVLDCMNHGLATVVNANGSMSDLDPDAVLMLAENFDDADLISALERLYDDQALRRSYGEVARRTIATKHAPRVCALQYAEAIERFYRQSKWGRSGLIDCVSRKLAGAPVSDVLAVSESVSWSLPPRSPLPQLLIDLSEEIAASNGCASSVAELLLNPPSAYRVEPIYYSPEHDGYCYARRFALGMLGAPTDTLTDDLVDVAVGDKLMVCRSKSEESNTRHRKQLVDRGAVLEYVDTLSAIRARVSPIGAGR